MAHEFEPETLDQFKQALWDFLLEHCDVEKSGTLFIKFHADGKDDLMKRIRARARGYHREGGKERGILHEQRRHQMNQLKYEKLKAWKDGKARRRRWGWLRVIGIKVR